VISTDQFQNSSLALPAGWRVHPTFAREFFFPYSRSESAMPENLDQPEPEFAVSAILGIRKFGSTYQARVHWDGYPLTDATWEPLSNLTHAKELLTRFLKNHNRWHFLLQKLDQLLGAPTELVHYAPAPAISEMNGHLRSTRCPAYQQNTTLAVPLASPQILCVLDTLSARGGVCSRDCATPQ
jgi:hypothetical protein